MTSHEIRSRFIQYFERQGHLHLPSSSLVPEADPTLLFTNAGMVQFKGIFVGEQQAPGPRAVTSQKCLRVSGKHNDLEEVGRTARHHTFFEMLGNFSFGDYFKRDAIRFAWEFVVDELGLDPARLWATVHHSDDEAAELWPELTGIPAERVFRLGDKDNFWQMGETGPCGPCSELHYDMRPESERLARLDPETFVALGDADRFMEIWNLVFMQFERTAEGDQPLPRPSIDTGAGLERIAAILQGTWTNYHTDLFIPIIERAEEIIGIPYSRDPENWEAGLPFRVLADHARAVAFMLSDGVFPSNEGRGYVLRRILRRAGRYSWLLGRREPTLDRLVGVVVDLMGDVYPELAARRTHIERTTRAEEERFLATIEAGMNRFEEVAPIGSTGSIPGKEAFKLYDTFGFPLDLTELMAAERGWTVDQAGFDAALEEQRQRSRDFSTALGSSVLVPGGSGLTPESLQQARGIGADFEQEFVGYDRLRVETPVLAHEQMNGIRAFVLERNPFYVESGGQVSDSGYLRGDGWELAIESVVTNDRGQTVLLGEPTHGEIPGAPDSVLAVVEEHIRRDTERNHTATHLLHSALRSVLGEHVHQAGSLVAPDRLRFDFSHHGPLTAEERSVIERQVNEAIWGNAPVEIERRPYREALADGAMALFGEKYGDVVRTVSVPGVSLELCGGCHVRSTGQIGLFRIVSETGVAAGIRRIEAVTGPRAYSRLLRMEGLVSDLAERLRVPASDVPRRVEALLAERDQLEGTLAEQRGADSHGVARRLVEEAGPLTAEETRLVRAEIELPEGSDIAAFGDQLRSGLGSGAAIVHVQTADGKSSILGVVTDDWIRKGLKAGDLVRAASQATGSGGGGKPHLAQGGVGDPALVSDALDAAAMLAREKAAGGA